MTVVKMLEFGYWTSCVRLNLAGYNLLSTVVLFHLLGCVTCELSLNVDVGEFANMVEKVGSLYSAMNDCEYTCPEGYQRVKKPNYVPSPNGCGSYGVKVSLDQFPSITGCCNKHDICYDTCGSDKDVCDRKLNRCVKDICDSVKGTFLEQSCQSVAKVIYAGTAVLGCPAFLDAQKKACLCQPKKRRSNTHREL